MKRIKFIIAIILAGFIVSCSSDNDDIIVNPEGPGLEPGPSNQEISLPNRDLRAIWYTTVWEIDWPNNVYDKDRQQKAYIRDLDEFKKYNINAVFVQVRSMADAFYKSKYEPWSKYITGVRGKDPGYDVMQFMIDEAHKRDMEFHAWINPYRIDSKPINSKFPPIDLDIDDEMYTDYPTLRVYNPARPEVRQRIADIVEEIISNYDVDGIALDDYFYPSGVDIDDEKDYNELAEAGQSKEEFRFENVNKLIKKLHNLIILKKPEISLTISPQGNYDNTRALYADAEKWCKEGWLDVIMPQLYYSKYHFDKWLPVWEKISHNTTLMLAYGIYRVGDKDFPATNLQYQFEQIAARPQFKGGAFYSGRNFTREKFNPETRKALNYIKEFYKNPSIPPHNNRSIIPIPTTPQNVHIEGNQLKWDSSSSDNIRYVIYKIEPNTYNDSKVKADIVTITTNTQCSIDRYGKYFVSAINKRNFESELSEGVIKD